MAKTILLLTNSEHGQANVMLAVLHELLQHPDFDIHVASFRQLESRVTEVGSVHTHATFHAFQSPSMYDCIVRNGLEADMPHPPGVRNALSTYRRAFECILSWDGPEYIDIYKSCRKLICEINPAAIVIDPLLPQGMDACTSLNRKYLVLSPVTLKEIVIAVQPRLEHIWKHPCLISGFSFPVPWYYVPLNIYMFMCIIYTLVSSSRIKMTSKARREVGCTSMIPSVKAWVPDVQYICPALPEIDFPFHVPSNVALCGPIVIAFKPVAEVDSDLSNWLKKRRTILINLGSHIVSEVSDAQQIAAGIRIAIAGHPELQILWKHTIHEKDEITKDILADEIACGRVKIQKWLRPDPPAILQSGSVVCSVHHGGANSFYEATKFGVPQVVMPVWFDTYDTATKIDYLGIGVIGNRSSAPHVNGLEFGRALRSVVDDEPKANLIRKNAHTLGIVCQRKEGRMVACEKIIEVANTPESNYAE